MWTRLPLRWKGVVVVAVPLVPLAVIAVLVTRTANQQREAQTSVTRALTVKAEIATLVGLFAEADTGMRGYLLTRSPETLKAVTEARLSLLRPAEHLAALLPQGEQRKRLTHIVELARRRPITPLVQFAKTTPKGTPVPEQLLADSAKVMAQIRAEFAAMQQAEDAILAKRVGVVQQAHDRLLAVSLGGVGIGAVAALVATLAFTHGISKRDQELRQRMRDAEDARGELAVLNQELEAFSYSVSHDLRAPLRHISGFAALLEQRSTGRLDEAATRYLTAIKDAAARMGRLIDDLLAFSRAGRAPLSKRRVDLNTLVNDVKQELQSDGRGRDAHWCIQPLPAVDADPALLRVVLMNLMANGLKYSSTVQQPRIEIGTTIHESNEVVIFIRDNGVGFDMQYVDKLFGVFQRLHSAEEFDGTGIGLATVRRIVHRHGGRVWAEAAVDQGATFFVALPHAESNERAPDNKV